GLDACGYACSDHASWFRTGVPASMPFESRSRDRNRAIHTRRDTLETSGNNAAHAVKFARLAAAYVIELAKGEIAARPAPPAPADPPAPAPEIAATEDRPAAPGAPGHPGAAACVALFLICLWFARAAAARIG
ncbi:MAG TPA: M28 family peptidase, partial [Kofleriaceae bacterium]|nr:M28 family peptidase [Kofleriaceae bacterium]